MKSKQLLIFHRIKSINANCNYINKAFVFINEGFDYKNESCIYSLEIIKNKFGSYRKEVVP